MVSIFFRVDADKVIGFGHLYRCIELAKKSTEKGLQPIFILKFQTNSVLNIISSNKIKYELIDNKSDISLLEEIETLSTLKKKYNSQFIFLDIDHKLYKENTQVFINYLNQIDSYFQTIMFWDLSPILFNPKTLIIPYVGSTTYHSKLVKTNNRNLLGEKYFVLRKEFLSYKNTYSFKKHVSVIVVTMGGSNPCNSIEKAIESIISTSFTGKCIVIVGACAKLNLTINIVEKINNSAVEFNFIYNNQNFISHLLKADIVFTNSGLTKYETMFLGIPTFTFSINSEHENLMNSFEDETKSIIHVGDINNITIPEIAIELKEFIHDYKKRERFFINGKKIIDGKGASRILDYVVKEIKKNGQ